MIKYVYNDVFLRYSKFLSDTMFLYGCTNWPIDQ